MDAHCAVKLDGQNSVISKWLLPELLFSVHWSRGTKTLGTRLFHCGPVGHTMGILGIVDSE